MAIAQIQLLSIYCFLLYGWIILEKLTLCRTQNLHVPSTKQAHSFSADLFALEVLFLTFRSDTHMK